MKPRRKPPRVAQEAPLVDTPAWEPEYIFDPEQGQFVPLQSNPPVLGPALRRITWPALKVALVMVTAWLALLIIESFLPLYSLLLFWVAYGLLCVLGLFAAFTG